MPRLLKKIYRLMVADDPITPLLKVSKKEQMPQTLTTRELIQQESNLGQAIFGQLPPHVVRREFFNLDEKTWIWHEEVVGDTSANREVTTRYELQPRGVLKVQPGPRYSYLEGAELDNFYQATQAYYERVALHLYKIDPKTGEKI